MTVPEPSRKVGFSSPVRDDPSNKSEKGINKTPREKTEQKTNKVWNVIKSAFKAIFTVVSFSFSALNPSKYSWYRDSKSMLMEKVNSIFNRSLKGIITEIKENNNLNKEEQIDEYLKLVEHLLSDDAKGFKVVSYEENVTSILGKISDFSKEEKIEVRQSDLPESLFTKEKSVKSYVGSFLNKKLPRSARCAHLEAVKNALNNRKSILKTIRGLDEDIFQLNSNLKKIESSLELPPGKIHEKKANFIKSLYKKFNQEVLEKLSQDTTKKLVLPSKLSMGFEAWKTEAINKLKNAINEVKDLHKKAPVEIALKKAKVSPLIPKRPEKAKVSSNKTTEILSSCTSNFEEIKTGVTNLSEKNIKNYQTANLTKNLKLLLNKAIRSETLIECELLYNKICALIPQLDLDKNSNELINILKLLKNIRDSLGVLPPPTTPHPDDIPPPPPSSPPPEDLTDDIPPPPPSSPPPEDYSSLPTSSIDENPPLPPPPEGWKESTEDIPPPPSSPPPLPPLPSSTQKTIKIKKQYKKIKDKFDKIQNPELNVTNLVTKMQLLYTKIWVHKIPSEMEISKKVDELEGLIEEYKNLNNR